MSFQTGLFSSLKPEHTQASPTDFHGRAMERRNHSLATEGLWGNMHDRQATALGEMYIEWSRATKSDKESIFYGMDPQEFAQAMSAFGNDSFAPLNHNKFVRGLQRFGNLGDQVAAASNISTATEGWGVMSAKPISKMTGGDVDHWEDIMANTGMEMGGAVTNMALGAALTGGMAPMAGMVTMTGLDAYTDTRESGGSVKSALTQGAVAGASVGIMPGVGRLAEGIGANVARAGAQAAQRSGLQVTSQSLRSGILNTASRYTGREVGQFTAGAAVDVAGTGLDPERSLAELTEAEYLIPMLASNASAVIGDLALVKPVDVIRSRSKKDTPAISAEHENFLNENRRQEFEQYLEEEIARENAPEKFDPLELQDDPFDQAIYNEQLRQFNKTKTDVETAAAFHASDWSDIVVRTETQPINSAQEILSVLTNHARTFDLDPTDLRIIAERIYEPLGSRANPAEAAERLRRVLTNQRNILFDEFNQFSSRSWQGQEVTPRTGKEPTPVVKRDLSPDEQRVRAQALRTEAKEIESRLEAGGLDQDQIKRLSTQVTELNKRASDFEDSAAAGRVVKDDRETTLEGPLGNAQPSAGLLHAYKANQAAVKEGRAHLLFHDAEDDFTVLRYLDEEDMKEATVYYKGKRRIDLEENLDLIAKHDDAVQLASAQFMSPFLRAFEEGKAAQLNGTVARSADVPERVGSAVNDILVGLGISTPVVMKTRASLTQEPVMNALFPEHKRGAYIRHNAGENSAAVILLDDPENVNVLLHELGHFVMDEFAGRDPKLLKEVQDFAFKEYAKTSKKGKNFFRNLPDDVEIVREFKKQGLKPDYSFPEWFANEFSRWAKQPSAPTKSVLDRFMKDLVTRLKAVWDKLTLAKKYNKPTMTFQKYMKGMTDGFFMKLADQDKLFKYMVAKFDLDDRMVDHLGRKLYENPHAIAHWNVHKALDSWRKNKGSFEEGRAAINRAFRDSEQYLGPGSFAVDRVTDRKAKTKIKTPETKAKVRKGQLVRSFTGRMIELEQVKAGFGPDLLTNPEWTKVVSYANELGFDEGINASALVRQTITAWAYGDLKGQKETPSGGGLNRLMSALDEAANSHRVKKQVRSLKEDGELDTSNRKKKIYETEAEAEQVAAGLKTDLRYEGYQFTVKPHATKKTNGFVIQAEFSEFMNHVSFDQVYKDHDHSAVELAVAREAFDNDSFGVNRVSPEELQDLAREMSELGSLESHYTGVLPSPVRALVSHAAKVLPDGEAQKVVGKGLSGGGDVSGNVMTVLRGSNAPQRFLDLVDEVKGLNKEHADFASLVRGFGKEIGFEGDGIDGLVQKFVEGLDGGKDYKDLLNLAPDALKEMLEEATGFWDKVKSVEEFSMKAGLRFQVHNKSLAELRGVRGQAVRMVTKKQVTKQLEDLIQSSSAGGMAVKMQQLGRSSKAFMRAYENTFMGFAHFAEQHPILRPLAQVLASETRDQSRFFNDIMLHLHAEDPRQLKKDFKKDRAWKVVSEDEVLRNLFSEMVLLENYRSKGVKDLLAEGDKEMQGIIDRVPGDKIGKFMELRERMYRSQLHQVQLRAEQLRELDQLKLAGWLSREVKGDPMAALGAVESFYKMQDPAQLAKAVADSGLDSDVAGRLMQFKETLDQSTKSVISKLQQRPWYVSEQRYGRYLVRFSEKVNGKVQRGAVSFDNESDARVWIAENKGVTVSDKGIEDTSIRYGAKVDKDFREHLASALDEQKAVIKQMFGDEPEMQQAVSSMMDEALLSVESASAVATKGSAEVTRRFGRGRSELDALEQQFQSARRLAVGLSRARTDAYYNLLRNDQAFLSTEGARIYALADQARKNHRVQDTKTGNLATKLSFTMFMGLNASSVVQEVVSMPMIVAPVAMEFGAGFKEAFDMQGKALAEVGKIELGKGKLEYRQLVDRAERENALTAKHFIDFDESIALNDLNARRAAEGREASLDMRDASSIPGKTLELAYQVGSKMYNAGASRVAKTNLIVGFELARKADPKADFDTLYNEALRFHGVANGAFGRAGRPIGLFSTHGAMRSVSQAANALQGFGNAMISNWVRQVDKSFGNNPKWTKAERTNARKALGTSVALTLSGLGLIGFPMAAAINTLVQQTFGVNIEQETRRWLFEELGGGEDAAFAANFATRGALYAFDLPIDLQSRLAVGGAFAVNAYDGLDTGFWLGSLGALMEQTKMAIGAYKRGGVPAALPEFAPTGLKRLARMTVNDGMVVSSTGEMKMDPTTGEKIGMALGFTPGRLKREQLRSAGDVYFSQKDTTKRKQIARTYVDMVQRGDRNVAERYLEKQAQEIQGRRPIDEEVNLIRRAAQDVFLTEHNVTAGAYGKSSASLSLAYLAGLESPRNATEQFMLEQQAKQVAGLPVNPASPAQMMQMNAVDQVMLQQPLFTPGLAEAFVDQNQLPTYRNPYLGDHTALLP